MLKFQNCKLGIDELETTPVYLKKFSNAVKNEVVKKNVNSEFLEKVNAIQTITQKKILDYDHGKYITTQEFNNLTREDFAGRLAHVEAEKQLADLTKK